MVQNPNSSFLQTSWSLRSPSLLLCPHPSSLLLFTIPLLLLRIQFKECRVSAGSRGVQMCLYRHRILCSPERGGSSEEPHSLPLFCVGAGTNGSGCSHLNPAAGLTCTQISGEVNFDPPNHPRYQAQSLGDMSLVPFLLQSYSHKCLSPLWAE